MRDTHAKTWQLLLERYSGWLYMHGDVLVALPSVALHVVAETRGCNSRVW
jgi:hypothetical protein